MITEEQFCVIFEGVKVDSWNHQQKATIKSKKYKNKIKKNVILFK